MRKAAVFRNDILAGELSKNEHGNYVFRYTNEYFLRPDLPAISLSFPKTKQEYRSDILFPFFFNMLSEGMNLKLQARQLKIDEKDYFSLLLAIASVDTIGAIRIEPILIQK